MKNKSKLAKNKGLYGYIFIAPLLFGLIVLFGIPIMQSIVFSFCKITISANGFSPTFNGFSNYYKVLFEETTYREAVARSILNMLLNVPLITIFSFFVANILNQKFFGREVIRVIFFLPLVLSSAALISFDNADMLQGTMASGGFKEATSILGGFESVNFAEFLIESGFPSKLVEYLTTAADRIYEIVILSGVQVLLFLAGLQSIPRSAYEAASIEGATGWECYWKITFPLISPIVFTCVIFTIIDSFAASSNETVNLIQSTAFDNQNFGLSSAMSWIYFVMIIIILAVVSLVLKKSLNQEGEV